MTILIDKILIKLLRNKFPHKAMDLYERISQAKNFDEDVELLLDMALLYDEMGEKTQSEATYRKIISIEPKDPRAYFGVATLLDSNESFQTLS